MKRFLIIIVFIISCLSITGIDFDDFESRDERSGIKRRLNSSYYFTVNSKNHTYKIEFNKNDLSHSLKSQKYDLPFNNETKNIDVNDYLDLDLNNCYDYWNEYRERIYSKI